jgi:hypothetical protein
MIPLDVDALLAQTRGKSPCAGVTRVTEVTPSVIPYNHAGQGPLAAVTHADPFQGNTGNTSVAGAPDAEAVTPVTQRPPALGNSRIVSQYVDTSRISKVVTQVTRVTQKNEQVVQALETPAGFWRCRCCQGTRRWCSVYNVLICGQCHPPADAALVAGWDGEDVMRVLTPTPAQTGTRH